MVGHIAEVDQVVAVEFRKGNEPPNKNNLEFIHQAERSMPPGIAVKRLRSDSAAYQIAIIMKSSMPFVRRKAILHLLKTPIKK